MYFSDMPAPDAAAVFHVLWRKRAGFTLLPPSSSAARRQPHHVIWRCRDRRAQVHLNDGWSCDLAPGEALAAVMSDIDHIRALDAPPAMVQWVSFADPGLPPLPRHLRNIDAPLVDAAFGRLLHAYHAEGGRSTRTRHWLQTLLQTLSEDHPWDDSGLGHDTAGIIDRHCRAIDSTPGKAWRIAEIAARSGWSTDHFARLFRQRTGLAPRAYLTRARLHAAAQRLREDNDSIQQIANDLGYSDAFHFSKQFKGRFGMSPLHWRQGSMSQPQ